MSNLTPELEQQFYDIYMALDGASNRPWDTGPLEIRDLLKDLEEQVDRILESRMCPACLLAYEQQARDYSQELTFAHTVSVGMG